MARAAVCCAGAICPELGVRRTSHWLLRSRPATVAVTDQHELVEVFKLQHAKQILNMRLEIVCRAR